METKKNIFGVSIIACKGDLTEQKTDAIVNAANSYLAHGGGVAGAIVRKGGKVIQQESDSIVNKYGPVNVGKAVYTSGGNLFAKYVIHTVGPRWGEGSEEKKLHDAVISVLELAKELKIKSISIPAISTGIFGFPKEKGVAIIVSSVIEWLKKNNSQLKEIRFCSIDNLTYDLFKKEIEKL